MRVLIFVAALLFVACAQDDAEKVAQAASDVGGEGPDEDVSPAEDAAFADSSRDDDASTDEDSAPDDAAVSDSGAADSGAGGSGAADSGRVDAEEDVALLIPQRGCARSGGQVGEAATSTRGDVPWCTAAAGDTDVEWSWVHRPTESIAWILGPSRVRVPLVLDLAGEYTIALSATDAAGEPVREEFAIARVNGHRASPKELDVILYWDPTSDPDPVANQDSILGPDMDVVIRNVAAGCWFDEGASCAYFDSDVSWGDGLRCYLDVDGRGGVGPEYMQVNTRELVDDAADLAVGVGLNHAGGLGPLTAYLVVYYEGRFVAAAAVPTMHRNDDFAEMMRIRVSGAGVGVALVEQPLVLPQAEVTCEQ